MNLYDNWTADFKEFKKKVESVLGPLDRLAKEAPDVYAHQVLSHGFMEYNMATGICDKIRKECNRRENPILFDSRLKEEYLKLARKNNLPEELLELGWIEYMND